MNLANQPLQLADGRACLLIPGKHSALQIAIVEKFGPRFAIGATVLYLSDILARATIYEKDRLGQLGIVTSTLNELSDIILYSEAKHRLYLIEVGISHRAITRRRRQALEQPMKECSATRIYISAFLNHAEFGRYCHLIAWESHVWLADIPEHMIHYDGEQYIIPHG